MQNILLISQVVIGVLITTTILLQSQGTGLSSGWSGGGGENYHTKRGVEKTMYYATIGLVALFAIVSVLTLTIQ